MKRLTAIAAAVVLLLTMTVSTPVAANTTLHVGSGQAYANIQDAIDAATSGDTIIVHNGTYEENVDVHKSLTIQAAAEDTPVVDGDTGEAFSITADNVIVAGFEAINSSMIGEYPHVIKVESAENVIIHDNIVTGGPKSAIALYDAYDCEVTDNDVSNPEGHGIRLKESTGNLIQENTVFDSMAGIEIDTADNNEVIDNEVSECTEGGIFVEVSTGNLIMGNEVTDSERGIVLREDANGNEVVDNEVSGRCDIGISVKGSSGNLISGNTVSGIMDNGISVDGSSSNLINGNTVSGIMDNGIEIVEGSNDNEATGNEISDSGEGMPSIEIGSDAGPMAIAPDGTIYAAVSLWDDEDDNGDVDLPDERYITVLKSFNQGYTWRETEFELDFTTGNFTVQIAVSPNYEEEETIYVGTYGGTVYRLEEEGEDVVALPDIPDVDELYSIDVWFDGDDDWVLAGTNEGVFIYAFGDWDDQQLENEAYEVAFAPDFEESELIWAVTDNATGAFMITSTVAPGEWGDNISEVEIDIAASPWVDLDFPDDYESDPNSDNTTLFAALSSPDGGGVYLIEGEETPSNSAATELMGDENIVSIAVSGNADEAIILAGALETSTVYIGEDGGDDWSEANENPTGDWWTHVYMEAAVVWDDEVFDPDDSVAFASTSGDDPEGYCDESAVFRSEDGGDTWSWRGIIDAELEVIQTGIFVGDSDGNLIEQNDVFNTGRRGIIVRKASDNNIMKNEVSGPTRVGIGVGDSDGNLIKQNEVSNTLYGLSLGSANGNRVFGNRVSELGEQGIELEESTDNFIKDNEVSDSSGMGIRLGEGSHNNRVFNNEISGCDRTGIGVRDSDGNLIKQNEISNTSYGLALGRARGNEVFGNKVSQLDEVGIEIEDSTGNFIKDNEISESGGHGITVIEESDGNKVYNNDVSRCDWEGIAVNKSYNNIIKGNMVSECKMGGITVANDADGNEVSGNEVSGRTKENAILLENSRDNLVKGNCVSGTGAFGILLAEAFESEIKGNEVTGEYKFGIAAVDGSEDNLIKTNSVFGSTEDDLRDDDWPYANTWVNNKYGSASWE